MIKLVAADMDGTLLKSDGHVSQKNAEAIRRLKESGIEFLVCTGRSYQDAMAPLAEWNLRTPAVCLNGAGLYDDQGRLIDKNPLSLGQVREILNACKDQKLFVEFVASQGNYTIMSKEELRSSLQAYPQLPAARIPFEMLCSRYHFVTLGELFEENLEFYKISLIHPSKQVLELIKTRLAKADDLSIASSSPYDLELTHGMAQKGRALAAYAAMKGIRLDEAMAIGDSENDHSMLSMKLKYTLAMENAMDSTKRTARCQTRSNDEDGVSYAIETLIFSPRARAC